MALQPQVPDNVKLRGFGQKCAPKEGDSPPYLYVYEYRTILPKPILSTITDHHPSPIPSITHRPSLIAVWCVIIYRPAFNSIHYYKTCPRPPDHHHNHHCIICFHLTIMAKKRKRRDKPSPSLKTESNDVKSCLAQRLKKYRGIAANTPPPPIYESHSGNNFLTPQSQAFEDCLDTSYKGFCYDPPEELPKQLHQQYEASFRGMNDLFLYDTIQPGKKRLTRTSVTRTLVGEPGSTYKYLGLRLFSHPWVDVDVDGNATDAKNPGSTLSNIGYPALQSAALIEMGRVNQFLRKRSNELLEEHVSPNTVPVGLVGSADYNLTLVNKMDSTATKRDLKKESAYGMGKGTSSKSCDKWGVALRAMDGGAGGVLSSVPALMVPLPSGSLYYMLDDFNHNHEHAVIAGSDGVRYSSTHRVAREGQGTWQYIRDKTDQFIVTASKFDFTAGAASTAGEGSKSTAKKRKDKFISVARAQQMLMNEIEFEWLRQWYIQGRKHASLHHYWHHPVEKLCASFCKLEKASASVVKLLKTQSSKEKENCISEDLYDVIIECLSERSTLRKAWKERYRDPVFEKIPEDERPFNCSCLDRVTNVDQMEKCLSAGQMPEDLD
eukprot:scaffold87685_cov34-Cyclotella_meneghiniana.AAC.1